MKYDLIVVTAANEAQARGYRAQLKGRPNVMVVADPGGRRVGSLGATVNVLKKVKVKGEGEERNTTVHLTSSPSPRILICHSGGDARRTPGYAAMGKAFVPMTDGRPLIDHIIDEMEKLPAKDGVTVCCGDVIPYLDYKKVDFAPKGVTGVAYPDGPWQAQRHGVYQVKGEGEGEGVKVKGEGVKGVTGFLQKPKVTRGRHLIDTGILHFDWETAAKMRKLPIAGDIYEEFPKMLLEGFAPFHVAIVPTCEFFHIGSSRELLRLLGAKGVLVDGVKARLGRLGGDNIVTNVPREYGRIDLAKGECLTSLPLGKDGWYHLRYHIDDNFKQDGLWEKHGLGGKMKKVNHGRLLDLRANRLVRVTAPVRIDFAGGWSDTPPICNREGGTVLAAAVRLDDARPVEVTITPRRDKFVKVVSKDLGKRRLIRSAAEIADHHDPHDWCCLVKSALAVTGFVFGSRGIDITISADLPKGSGMGTSSILGAATIAALLGESPVDTAKVGELTLRLEQEMRTGGGWQDQFAGMLPGVKLMRSKPGEKQKITIENISLPPGFARELKARSLLYFTGQKRMARNVLRRVLGFYADNPHNFGKILVDSLKKSAVRAAKAAGRGDLAAFADCINEYWRDKKLLDAGSTNEKVDDIIDTIRPRVSAVTLAGAGGGGFMYILAKSPADAREIRRFLERNPPSPHSRFYDFSVDEEGMDIHVED